MTEGETLFYLREIHLNWATSNVSMDKLAELEAGKLIEINSTPVPAVRLTSEGARRKTLGRRASSAGGLSLTRKQTAFRPHRQRKVVPQVKPLV